MSAILADGEVDLAGLAEPQVGTTPMEAQSEGTGQRKRGRPRKDRTKDDGPAAKRGCFSGSQAGEPEHQPQAKAKAKGKAKAKAKAKAVKLTCWGCGKAFDSLQSTSRKFEPTCKLIADRLYKAAAAQGPARTQWLGQELASPESAKKLIMNYKARCGTPGEMSNGITSGKFILAYYEEIRGETSVFKDVRGEMLCLDDYVSHTQRTKGTAASVAMLEWQNWFADARVYKDIDEKARHRVFVKHADEVTFRNAITKAKVAQFREPEVRRASLEQAQRAATRVREDHEEIGGHGVSLEVESMGRELIASGTQGEAFNSSLARLGSLEALLEDGETSTKPDSVGDTVGSSSSRRPPADKGDDGDKGSDSTSSSEGSDAWWDRDTSITQALRKQTAWVANMRSQFARALQSAADTKLAAQKLEDQCGCMGANAVRVHVQAQVSFNS